MLRSRDSRVLQRKDKNKFEINKEILLYKFCQSWTFILSSHCLFPVAPDSSSYRVWFLITMQTYHLIRHPRS